MLTIQNYALINELKIDLNDGFSTITGETGAGKSILLGAFSLLVGQRADTSVLLDKTRKCIVEGVFNIKTYQLEDYFIKNEIDYDHTTIIRREVHDTGRSRAFVNDTPVNLSVLKDLGDRLVDIHSQHSNLYLNNVMFRFGIIDSLAKNNELFAEYQTKFKEYHQTEHEYAELLEGISKSKTDLDFLQFQLNELARANLISDETENLESESRTLSHAEDIRASLGGSSFQFSGEDSSILNRMKESITLLSRVKDFYPDVSSLLSRAETAYIEIKDLASEAERLANNIEVDPKRLDQVNQRLDLLYSLFKKYHVANSIELIEEKNKINHKINEIDSSDTHLEELRKHLQQLHEKLAKIGGELSSSREEVIPEVEKKITDLLKLLGMPNAIFTAKLEKTEDFFFHGMNKLSLLFSANKQVEPLDISKVASGGELSRLMLTIKSVVSTSLALPSIVFDEIDTGVSGEIADKMATMMKRMSEHLQVISITHLPQVAAKGNYQYLVFKKDSDQATNTYIKELSKEERVHEIAKMLSGAEMSKAALENAQVLLKN